MTNTTASPPPSTAETTPAIPTPTPTVTSESPPQPPLPLVPPRDEGMPTGTLVGMIVGIGIGGISMLLAVGIFVIFYKRWKRKKMIEQGFENYKPGGPPKDTKSERFWGN